MQATADTLDFPEIHFPRTTMGTKPTTRLDSWAQAITILGAIITLGALILSAEIRSEHRLTVIEQNSSQQTRLAETAATDSHDAREVAKLTARLVVIMSEVVRALPAARPRRQEMDQIVSDLKNKRISEGGAMGPPISAGAGMDH